MDERISPLPQPDRPVLDLSPTPEGWKAELTWVLDLYQHRWFT